MWHDNERMAPVDPAEANARSDLNDRMALLPCIQVALGDPEMPVERLIWLQSAVAGLVRLLADLRWPRATHSPVIQRRLLPQ
jgi:hypothetical protein